MNALLPVLPLVFEWGFVFSPIAFMVSVTGTGYSHMRFSEADVLLETLYPPPTHTKTHTQKECQSSMKKRHQWGSISLPALNLTFELYVYWYCRQVWLGNGIIKKQLGTMSGQICYHKVSNLWLHLEQQKRPIVLSNVSWHQNSFFFRSVAESVYHSLYVKVHNTQAFHCAI